MKPQNSQANGIENNVIYQKQNINTTLGACYIKLIIIST